MSVLNRTAIEWFGRAVRQMLHSICFFPRSEYDPCEMRPEDNLERGGSESTETRSINVAVHPIIQLSKRQLDKEEE